MTAVRAAGEWQEGATEAWKSARGLLRLKQYDHALFFCHLTLEKILKALVVQRRGREAPPIHGLFDLAKIAQVRLTSEQEEDLQAINGFSIAGRYPGDESGIPRRGKARFARTWAAKTQILYDLFQVRYAEKR